MREIFCGWSFDDVNQRDAERSAVCGGTASSRIAAGVPKRPREAGSSRHSLLAASAWGGWLPCPEGSSPPLAACQRHWTPTGEATSPRLATLRMFPQPAGRLVFHRKTPPQ